MTEQPRPATILVVDDTPANLQLLSGILKGRGYRVKLVPNGRLALEAARRDPPDLVLLDISMPEMDGYEVCRRLKADEALATIPVIFISALDDPSDKVRAFREGGVDYVPKPFNVEEVSARIRTHLQLENTRQTLDARNQELQDRYRELRELEELRDNLVHMVVHDMRAPMMVIDANLQYLGEDLTEALDPAQREALDDAVWSVQRLRGMVQDLLDVSRLETGQMPLEREQVDLRGLARMAAAGSHPAYPDRTLDELLAESPVEVTADPELVRRVLGNLLDNALKYSGPRGHVRVAVTPIPGGGGRVVVEDDGPGIPKDQLARIFDKFAQVEARREKRYHSTGLGLTFCKLAIEAHQGRIAVDSTEGQGSRFTVDLPP